MRAPSICDSQPPPLLLCVARRFFLLLATIVTTGSTPSAKPSALAAHTVTAVATAAAALASTAALAAAALAAAAHATAPNVVLDLGDAPLMFLLRLIADLSRPAARGFFERPLGLVTEAIVPDTVKRGTESG